MASDSDEEVGVLQASGNPHASLSAGAQWRKEPPKQASPCSAVTRADGWVEVITTAFSQTHQRIGKQVKPFSVASGCSGTGAATIALEASPVMMLEMHIEKRVVNQVCKCISARQCIKSLAVALCVLANLSA